MIGAAVAAAIRGARLSYVIVTGLIANMAASAAHADTRWSVNVSGGPKIASNPFLLEGDDTEAAALSFQVDPSVVFQDETSTFQVTGSARFDQWSRRYNSDESLSLSFNGSARLDERTTLTGSGGFLTSRGSVSDRLLTRSGPIDIDNIVPLIPIDPTVAGIGSRVNTIDSRLGLEYLLSPRDIVSVGAAYQQTWLDSSFGSNYRELSADVAYGRRLSERTVVRGVVRFGQTEYFGRRTDDGFTITPLIGVDRDLSATLKLALRAGVFYARSDQGDGTKRDRVGFSGDASLCNSRGRSSYCLSASRSAQPTAFAGITAVTAVSASYDRLLNERDRISFTANYSTSGQSRTVGVSGAQVDFIGASATATRDVSRRFMVFITPSFAKALDNQFERDANFAAVIGLRYRLGDRQ